MKTFTLTSDLCSRLSPEQRLVFIQLLVMADEDGVLETSTRELARVTGLTVKAVHGVLNSYALKHLMTRFVKHQNSLITINNIDGYKENFERVETPSVIITETPTPPIKKKSTNDIYSNPKEKIPPLETSTSTKVSVEPKQKKSKSEIEQELVGRMKVFYDELVIYVDRYGKDMVRAFYDFWSEPNPSRTKMRKELEKTWDTSRRLSTWERKDKEIQNRYGNNRTVNGVQREFDQLGAALAEQSWRDYQRECGGESEYVPKPI